MHSPLLRVGLRVGLFTLVLASSSFVFADQKIKTKSNIKNDRVAETSSVASCEDQKEGSADGKVACKTVDPKSSTSSAGSASSVTSKPIEAAKP